MPDRRDSGGGAEVRITLDGRGITAIVDQSIAAVLMADGVRSWRTTRGEGSPRGLFCGIGMCFDCLVELNGVPNVRACLTRVQDGDVVTSQEGTGHGDLAR
jgi:predicted molibdopterin-dependent oxidoreductase YjgC